MQSILPPPLNNPIQVSPNVLLLFLQPKDLLESHTAFSCHVPTVFLTLGQSLSLSLSFNFLALLKTESLLLGGMSFGLGLSDISS